MRSRARGGVRRSNSRTSHVARVCSCCYRGRIGVVLVLRLAKSHTALVLLQMEERLAQKVSGPASSAVVVAQRERAGSVPQLYAPTMQPRMLEIDPNN